jgi:hypothetical protein
MTGRPKRCEGSGQPAQTTYTRQARTSGGVVRQLPAADCPVDSGHSNLPVHGGRVQSHSR